VTHTPAFIAGRHVAGTTAYDNIDPATGKPIGTVIRSGAGEIDQAVQAAWAAQSDWNDTPPAEIASVAATFGLPRRVAYAAAKTGIVGMTRTLAAEWGPHGVRVNAVAPGYVDTDMVRSGFRAGTLDERALLARTPLRRLATPEDIAAAIGFLVSPAASFITGVMLPVDGGLIIDGTFDQPQATELAP
jgi:hypothetical protein